MSNDDEVPEGWSINALTDVADVIMGQSPPGSTYNTTGDGLPFFQGKSEFGEDHPTAVKWCTQPTRVAEADDILMSVRAPVGPTNVADQRCAIGRGLAIIRPKPGVPTNLLRHALMLQEPEIASWGTGTTFTAINKGHFKDIKVSLPPVPLREHLASLIDDIIILRRSSARRLAAAERSIKRFRQAVLTAACSGRLTDTWRDNHQPTRTGGFLLQEIQAARHKTLGKKFKGSVPPDVEQELPETWVWTTVGTLVDVATGATPLRSRSHYYGGSVPWVTSGAVNAGLITEAAEYITDRALQETNAKVFPVGTLLVAMYGEGQTRGRVGELGIAAATNQAVAALLFDETTELLRNYMRIFFLENYERIRRLSFGGVQPNLSLGVIRTMPIPLPPMEEQDEIVRRVQEFFDLAESLRSRINRASLRIDQSGQSVLAKAFRGGLTGALG